MSLPILHMMPRVTGDIDRCLDFVGRQPWGKPDERELDIYRGIAAVCTYPDARRPEVLRTDTRLWLRRYRVAQFVIIYAYLESRDPSLPDVVSIRAVRHMRVANVFAGVKEAVSDPYVNFAEEK